MADPITAGIAITAISSAVAAGMQGIQGYQQAHAESEAATYNAKVLAQQGNIATNTAAANEGASLRRSAAELGSEAAGFGEANIGTGATVQNVERQSETNSRMDALNIWYGGELERHQALSEATAQRYESQVDASNATGSLVAGGVGAGTSLLMGGAKYGAYQKYGLSGLGLTSGYGGSA